MLCGLDAEGEGGCSPHTEGCDGSTGTEDTAWSLGHFRVVSRRISYNIEQLSMIIPENTSSPLIIIIIIICLLVSLMQVSEWNRIRWKSVNLRCIPIDYELIRNLFPVHVFIRIVRVRMTPSDYD